MTFLGMTGLLYKMWMQRMDRLEARIDDPMSRLAEDIRGLMPGDYFTRLEQLQISWEQMQAELIDRVNSIAVTQEGLKSSVTTAQNCDEVRRRCQDEQTKRFVPIDAKLEKITECLSQLTKGLEQMRTHFQEFCLVYGEVVIILCAQVNLENDNHCLKMKNIMQKINDKRAELL
jgi:hypothetical protein